jgi:glycosyltransferase involved in cell wall biosynthesis
MSLLEAMACGATPVVSDIPANHEWVNNQVNGFIVNPNNIDKINEVFNYIYINQNLIKQYSKTNYNIVFEKANHHTEMTKMEVLYKNLIK